MRIASLAPSTEKHPVSEAIRQVYPKELILRLIEPEEDDRWDKLIEKHHYLKKARMVGETLRYVAEQDGKWIALLGWSSAAFHLKDRDNWIGWSHTQRHARRHLVACNARFLILPKAARQPNLASQILSLNLARLSQDWLACHDHPILLVETFVDPKLFEGTCYRASNWIEVGKSKGFGRSRLDFYQLHAQPKSIFLYPLHRQAQKHLSAACLPANLKPYERQDLRRYPLSVPHTQSLLAAYDEVTDPRGRKGRRHRHVSSILAMSTAAMIAGNNTYTAIGDFVASLSQQQLRCLRACRDSKTRRWMAPSEPAIRRVIQAIDPKELDGAVTSWLRSHESPGSQGALAVDGKAVRTVSKINGQPFQLFSVLSHQSRLVYNQIKIPDKTNEIPAVKDLLRDLDIEGSLVTLDALHTQKETARYLVEDKKADYLLTVKSNQPTILKNLVNLIAKADFFPSGNDFGPRPRTT